MIPYSIQKYKFEYIYHTFCHVVYPDQNMKCGIKPDFYSIQNRLNMKRNHVLFIHCLLIFENNRTRQSKIKICGWLNILEPVSSDKRHHKSILYATHYE